MKRTLLATFAACAFGAIGSAHADTLYGKVEGGGTFDGRYALPGPDADLDGGWQAGAALGLRANPNVRFEGEVSYAQSDLKGGPGRSETTRGLANAYYDFRSFGAVTPFVGAGVGVAKFDAAGARDTGFAYKLTAGLARKFSPGVTGEIAYRYDDAPNLRLASAAADYRESAVTAGLRFNLGRD